MVRRLANDLRYGQDASRYVGTGVDYVQSRPFVDGDPVRDIDWNVTARSGKFHVKQYESVKNVPIYLVVDTSSSMAFRSGPLSKHVLATLIAGGLGLAALERLSPVGVLAAGSRQLRFRPSMSRTNMFHWLHELRRHGFGESTQIARRLDELQGHLKSCSLVIVISDLHDPDAMPAIKRIAQVHDCVVLQLEDPVEQGRLRGGFFRGTEAETGRQFVAHGRTRWFLNADASPDVVLPAAGIDYLRLYTDQPFVTPLRRFLSTRGMLTRNTR